MQNKISLINFILIGVCAILYLLYNNFISVAAMAASFISNTFNETQTAIEIARIIIYDGLFTIILYTLLTIINYILHKRQKQKMLLVFFVVLISITIFLILKNIFTLI